jgi:hypothetical protein
MQLPPDELYARAESPVNEVFERQFARQTRSGYCLDSSLDSKNASTA